MELKIEYLPKEELKPYAGNAKLHPAEQVEQIKNSIKDFGFNDPIAIWGDNEIVEGHGRLLAAMEMPEITTIPVVRLDHLTDKQRKAYIIAHNKLTLNTTFDNELLGEEIRGIMDEIDMTDYGFGDFELSILTEDFSPDPYDEADIADYTKDGETGLAKQRVIITYNDNQAPQVAMLLGVDEIKKVVYDISEIA